MKLRRNKNEERASKLLLKELPYFNFTGCLELCHGQLNSSISDTVQPRGNLDKLTSLYDLGIFNLNTVLDVNLSTDCNLPNQRIQSRYFSPHSWDRMIANGANCSDKLFSTFYNKYNKIVNKHAPFKRLSNRKAKQLSKPWITTGIKASIAVKNKLYASGDDSRYKYYRNKICSLIRLSKKRYYYEYFEHNVTNMKKTWE